MGTDYKDSVLEDLAEAVKRTMSELGKNQNQFTGEQLAEGALRLGLEPSLIHNFRQWHIDGESEHRQTEHS